MSSMCALMTAALRFSTMFCLCYAGVRIAKLSAHDAFLCSFNFFIMALAENCLLSNKSFIN